MNVANWIPSRLSRRHRRRFQLVTKSIPVSSRWRHSKFNSSFSPFETNLNWINLELATLTNVIRQVPNTFASLSNSFFFLVTVTREIKNFYHGSIAYRIVITPFLILSQKYECQWCEQSSLDISLQILDGGVNLDNIYC